MKKHLRVLRTLFVKDIVDMFKNPNVLLMLALPLIFIVIYQFVDLGMSPAYLLMLGVMMNLCLTPLSVLGMMTGLKELSVASEKNTMRTLMLCNVTGGEFLAAKTLAVLAGTLLVDTVLFFLTGFGPAQLPVFLLVCTAGSMTMLLLGGLTGIVCRDQTSTGTIAGPLALVFMLPTMFAGMGGVLQKVASFVPTTATADLMFLGLGHQSWMGANVLWDVAVLAVWTAGSAGLFALAFRKKGVDN